MLSKDHVYAGEELDAWVAEHVMGMKNNWNNASAHPDSKDMWAARQFTSFGGPMLVRQFPEYSTDIVEATLAFAKFGTIFKSEVRLSFDEKTKVHRVHLGPQDEVLGESESFPLAVCRAMFHALERGRRAFEAAEAARAPGQDSRP